MDEMHSRNTISSIILSCIFLLCILFSVSSGDETDHLALLSVKKHITSDPYQIMPLWNDSIHFCNWTGIVCGLRHLRVVTLDLQSCGFSGSISPVVGNLTFLRELLLINNSFTGSVPPEVGRLSRLRRLRLSNNSLSGNDFKALVYSYMVNGSLEDWLHQNSVVGLNFLQRLNIVIDLAEALDYIHRQCGSLMIHCDIKPSNVLLDVDLVAHLGDFGLARFVHPNSSTSHTSSLGVKGTIGYAAPEYGMGSRLSTYGDVYSFGILILELFTGNRPTDDMFSDGLSLHSFVKMAIPDRVMEITDPVLFRTRQEENMATDARDSEMHDGIEDCLTSVYGIGIACSTEIPRDRIEISNALKQLLSVKKTFLKGRATRRIRRI